jgi:hypothetical protein
MLHIRVVRVVACVIHGGLEDELEDRMLRNPFSIYVFDEDMIFLKRGVANSSPIP